MCLICLEFQKGKLTSKQFVRNIGELIDSDPKHADEVIELISKQDSDLLDEIETELFETFTNENSYTEED